MRHSLSVAVLLLLAAAGAASAEPITGAPVSLAAPDGTKLAATYYSGDDPGPGILLLHQCNMDRSAWNNLAERLARARFHVLTLDYRGYGESGGKRHVDLPAQERVRLSKDVWPGDVDAAYSWLRARPGVGDVIGAGGASCGVNQAIQLSRRHPEVKSLVLLSGATDLAGRQFLRGKTSPPLLLAAADDDGGLVEFMAWLDAASGNSTNRFVEYETGGHGVDMFGPHPELPVEIVAWYDATLSGKGKPASTDNRARRESPTVRFLMSIDEPGGAARAVETLKAERRKDPTSPILDVHFVARLGYQVIQSGDAKDGVAIMRFNVEDHPSSSIAWNALGDAYLADGRRDEAREASEKTLQLVGSDASESEEDRKYIRDSAQGKLDQLKNPTS